MNRQKLILVTGGAGFIGSHLCERLARDGHRVISLDNYFTGSRSNHVRGVEYREGHTKDIARLVPEDLDVIYHLGEYSRVRHSLAEPSVTFDLNLRGTLGVLEYWRDKRCKLVYAGSSTKFAYRVEDGIEGKNLAPYTWSKAAMSDLIVQYARWYELPYSITYFYNVYGPRERGDQYGTLIEILHQNWLQGLTHRIAGSGNQKRAFTHVLDTIEGIILVGEKGEGDEYGICAKETYSLLDAARMFGGHLEYSSPTQSTRSSEAVDTARIQSLGWRQRHTLPGYIAQIKASEHPLEKPEIDFATLKPRKRVLIFSLVYYPNFHGGAEPAIKEITDRILPSDIEFHLVTCWWNSKIPRTERYGNILVHRIGFGIPDPRFVDYRWNKRLQLNKYLFQVMAALKGLQLHARYHYDGIWAIMAHSAGVPAAIFTLFSPRTPLVLTLQEGDPIEHIERAMKPVWPLFTRAFTSASIIQSVSNYLSNWARAMGYTGTIVLVKNGANPNDLKENYTQEQVGEIKQELGKKPGDIFLVNTSRLVLQKGHDLTIQALQYLPAHIKYVIVGDGEDEQKLRDLVRKLKLSGRVIFTGRVDRSIVTLYRKACDIFVAPSRSEGLGAAFVSALASRLPLVTSGVGGIADYAIDGETAWIVPPEDPKAIAEKVKEILAHPEKAHEISERARKMVERDYDWDKIAHTMQNNVFGKVL
ncbi:glycosyltransferase [Candidatus Kaiserbacteria bacterium]|nr:glycosyltransferase [Candidatus Kaiserbacteria bacterium]